MNQELIVIVIMIIITITIDLMILKKIYITVIKPIYIMTHIKKRKKKEYLNQLQ